MHRPATSDNFSWSGKSVTALVVICAQKRKFDLHLNSFMIKTLEVEMFEATNQYYQIFYT